jgi:hypothetical protein
MSQKFKETLSSIVLIGLCVGAGIDTHSFCLGVLLFVQLLILGSLLKK